MQEWRIGEQSRRIQTCVRRVLNELCCEALLRLKDPRLEVMILPEAEHSVWAYFPIHTTEGKKFKAERRRQYVQAIGEVATERDHAQILAVVEHSDAEQRRQLAQQTKTATQVVLVLSTARFEKEPVRQLEDHLRDHLGHMLLFLRDPKARNECSDAWREWQLCARPGHAQKLKGE